ncbi:chorismate synthase [Desulfoplanes sp.]
MSGNSFGTIFRVTTFGESHGPGLGGVVDGCPAGIELDETLIQNVLDGRKPGQGYGTTARKEDDKVTLLSGVFGGRTTGTSIGFYVANTDQRSRDYSRIKDIYRPGHGDFSYEAKYGFRDYRGGGRSSGRETVARVAAGAIAGQVLARNAVRVQAYTVELGGIQAKDVVLDNLAERPFFAADPNMVDPWKERIDTVRKQGDTLGGIVELRISGVPAGLGEPVFDKLDARLAQAVMSIGAVKGVSIGSGFGAARMLGSANNDQLSPEGFLTNNAGGILAGISSGQDIVVRAAIKPIPSINREQQTVDKNGRTQTITIGGRHDICAIPRVVPVLQAMGALVLADMVLMHRARG